MSETTFLRTSELISLTDRTRHDAQVRALRFMGIEHRVRPDGSVAVLRAHIHFAFGAGDRVMNSDEKEIEPDWDAV
ncbi:hypothetical protein W822_22525 [Advenella kashmirensis W13003]|uniref:DUF4224 domain-containing protein n=1 Tax=Advenella kashmirensis W13003 TaxID=1424334 RepID=V8QMJ4_9BURK|nr:DUF4224 domain-containing protein [Advenella kashmirensis]ETF00523.1 hypothetical protein W822_22525 [Advenella kashmirensis W13003]